MKTPRKKTTPKKAKPKVPSFFPKSVKIIDAVYQMRYVDSVKEVDPNKEEELYGHGDHENKVISIYMNKKSDDETWQIIWHEILHVVVRKLCLDEIDKHEEVERIIDLLATGVNNVIRDNKLKYKFK